MTSEAQVYSQTLGQEESIWFKISPFVNAADPMGVLKRLCAKQGGCVPVSFRGERIFFLSEIEYMRHALVDNVDNYAKYFDGLEPIFGKAMITIEGALSQLVRRFRAEWVGDWSSADRRIGDADAQGRAGVPLARTFVRDNQKHEWRISDDGRQSLLCRA